MKKAVYLLVCTLLALLIGSIPVAGFYRVNVFQSPFFLLLLLALGTAPVLLQWKKRRWDRQLGYILSHYGVLLLFIGIVCELTPLKKEGRIELHEGSPAYGRIELESGESYSLPFLLQLDKAEIDYYEVDLYDYYEIDTYDYYEFDTFTEEPRFIRQIPAARIGDISKVIQERSSQYTIYNDGSFITGDPRFIRQVPAEQIGKILKKVVEKTANHTLFNDGSFLQVSRGGMQVKEYRAYLKVLDRLQEPLREAILRVNHPISVDGHRIYLLNMGSNSNKDGMTVTFLVRKNVGALLTLGGMFVILAGIFFFFIRRPKKGEIV